MLKLLLLLFVLLAPCCLAAPPSVGGCQVFNTDWEYNTPIDTDPVDPLSDCYINQLTNDAPNPYLRLDMGNNLDDGYGIPWSSGAPASPAIDLDLSDGYLDESDCYDVSDALQQPCCDDAPCTGKWRAPYDTEIESQTSSNTNPDSGDRHTIYIDTDECLLYETYATHREGGSTWSAASSAVWDLAADFPQRPEGWTSADAAGLPIFPGLLRYEDVDSGEITHALRFTAENAQYAYVFPASHLGVTQNPYNLPYGIRLRLRADFNSSEYTPQGQILIAALKKYGMFFADQGTGFYLSGTSNTNWADEFFEEINQNGPGRRIHISNFEVVAPKHNITYGYDAGNVQCNGGGSAGSRMSSFAQQTKELFF